MFTLHYVAFPSLHEKPLTIAARLSLPSQSGSPAPAVVLLHGSAGPSGREGGYARALNEAGIATLEPDQWTARGLSGGAAGRPRTVHETLPDLFGAKRFLAQQSRVDAGRIGVLGFSFGGVAAMLAATKTHATAFGAPFAAFMPCYPICWMYGKVAGYAFSDLVDAPVFILTAALDQYDDDPQAGDKLVAALKPEDGAKVRTQAMADCHHGFDMPGVDVSVTDPSSHRGAGGTAIMRYNPSATTKAHTLAATFFADVLKEKAT